MKRKEQKSVTENYPSNFPCIVIPPEVLFSTNLTSTEKLLFGIVQNLAQGEDGCWASKSYLGNLLGVSNRTISKAITNLEKNEFIEICSETYVEQKGFKTNRTIIINPELSITKNQWKNNNNELDNYNPLDNNYPLDRNNNGNGYHEDQKPMIGVEENFYPLRKKLLYPLEENFYTLEENFYPSRRKFLTSSKKTSNEFKINNNNNKYIYANKPNELNDTVPMNEKSSNPSKPKKSNKMTWSILVERYGRPQVRFVRRFLKKQKENFPKFIKDDITPNNDRVLSSLDCLDKLQRIDGFDFETEIRPTLEAALQDEFWARNILSLGSLRKKGKNGEKKFINIMVTLSNRTKTSPFQSHKPSITPDDIIAEQGWDDFRIKLLKKSVFDPVFSKLNGASDKTEITKSICKLIKEIEKRQKRPKPPENEKDYQMRKFIFDKWELIPQANRIVKDFVKWLDNQDWIGELKPGHFDIDGRTFAMFRNYYQDSIGGFDIFEGRML